MDLELLAKIAANNGPDLDAIVTKIGIGTLLSLTPHFLAIAKTVQNQAPAQPQTPKTIP